MGSLINQRAVSIDFSRLLRLPSTSQPPPVILNDEIQPVFQWEPVIEVFGEADSATTIFTVPTGYEVYLTNFHMSGNMTSLAGAGIMSITYTPENVGARIVKLMISDGQSSTSDISLAGRGIRLAAGSAVTTASTCSAMTFAIYGYRLPIN